MTTPSNDESRHPSVALSSPCTQKKSSDANEHSPSCDSSTTSSTASHEDSTSSSKEERDQLEQLLDNQGGNKKKATFSVPPPRTSLVRVMSSCSIGSESPSCPICLDPMTPIDHQHPLQCPTRHCHFNFCASCIHSLLSSSKDDFEMASDGNAHVKIYLHCPNCRSDLSTTIRDVLLLRKVDTVLWLLHQRTTSSLNPSQQRTHQAMQELHVQEAIRRARDKEREFWKTHHRDSFAFEGDFDDSLRFGSDDGSRCFQEMSRRMSRAYDSSRLSLRENSSLDYGEEWGVEADLDNGVHSSFRQPPGQNIFTSTHGTGKGSKNKHSHNKNKNADAEHKVDETLLMGLESCMTHAERLQVTHNMISGDPDRLAEAARLLHKIENDARQGILPAHRQAQMNRRGSVYEIVEETRQIQQKQQQNDQHSRAPFPNNFNVNQALLPRHKQQQMKLAAERRQLEMALVERQSLLEQYPLPVRMPKAITLDLYYDPTGRNFPLRFCDDNWDGTVLDAYTKLNIAPAGRRVLAAGGSPWQVTKKTQTQHPGVFNVLSQGQYQRHYGSVELTMDQPSRVLVASVQGAAGRQGVMKGDVVTHIDGQPLQSEEGKAPTVHDLLALLEAKQKAGQEKVDMVLNADASVAEALKRRSIVME